MVTVADPFRLSCVTHRKFMFVSSPLFSNVGKKMLPAFCYHNDNWNDRCQGALWFRHFECAQASRNSIKNIFPRSPQFSVQSYTTNKHFMQHMIWNFSGKQTESIQVKNPIQFHCLISPKKAWNVSTFYPSKCFSCNKSNLFCKFNINCSNALFTSTGGFPSENHEKLYFKLPCLNSYYNWLTWLDISWFFFCFVFSSPFNKTISHRVKLFDRLKENRTAKPWALSISLAIPLNLNYNNKTEIYCKSQKLSYFHMRKRSILYGQFSRCYCRNGRAIFGNKAEKIVLKET